MKRFKMTAIKRKLPAILIGFGMLIGFGRMMVEPTALAQNGQLGSSCYPILPMSICNQTPGGTGSPVTPACPPGQRMNASCEEDCWDQRNSDVQGAIDQGCGEAIMSFVDYAQGLSQAGEEKRDCLETATTPNRIDDCLSGFIKAKRAMCREHNDNMGQIQDQLNDAVSTADAAYYGCVLDCCEVICKDV